MGMTCSLYRATEEEIERLIKAPESVGGFLDSHDGIGPPVRTVRPKGLLGCILRLFPITISEVASEPDDDASTPLPDPDRSIDIEKGWHGLHFLLTGTADEGQEPACYLMVGGEDLDDEGLVRALRPHQVRRFAEHLSALTPAELAQRYDPARMNKLDIYPGAIWTRSAPPGESPLEWLLECFAELQLFMARAASAGHGVVIHTA